MISHEITKQLQYYMLQRSTGVYISSFLHEVFVNNTFLTVQGLVGRGEEESCWWLLVISSVVSQKFQISDFVLWLRGGLQIG